MKIGFAVETKSVGWQKFYYGRSVFANAFMFASQLQSFETIFLESILFAKKLNSISGILH